MGWRNWIGNARIPAAALVVPPALVAGLVLARGSAPATRVPEDPTAVLGRPTPDVRLKTIGGESVSLRDRLNGRSALIIVMGPRDCTSCANLPLELRIVHSKFPHLETIVVGSGDAVPTFQTYFRASHFEDYGLLDEERALVRGLGVAHEPITMLVDSSGHILLIDARSSSQASQYPIGKVLLQLTSTLIRN